MRYSLELAREEGPGNKELPDLMQINIPFMSPIIFVFKVNFGEWGEREKRKGKGKGKLGANYFQFQGKFLKIVRQ